MEKFQGWGVKEGVASQHGRSQGKWPCDGDPIGFALVNPPPPPAQGPVLLHRLTVCHRINTGVVSGHHCGLRSSVRQKAFDQALVAQKSGEGRFLGGLVRILSTSAGNHTKTHTRALQSPSECCVEHFMRTMRPITTG